MGLQRTYDATADFAIAQNIKIDTSGWDHVIVQIQTPSAQINFNGTNDAGGVVGVTDGNAFSSINYQPVVGINTATNTPQVNTASNGLFRFSTVARFLQFVAAGGTTVGRLIIQYFKIS